MNTQLDRLLDFLIHLRYEDLPDATTHQAKRLLLESLSWMFMGSVHPKAACLYQYLDAVAQAGPSSVAGHSSKVATGDAILANAFLAQLEDANDGQRVASVYGGSYHPGRVILPCLIAHAEATRLSGRQFILALVAAYEVASRIRSQTARPQVEIYAGVMALAKASELNKRITGEAINIASHITTRINENDFNVNDLPFLTNGVVAGNAYTAVQMAKFRLSGTDKFSIILDDHYIDFEELGETFGIDQIYFKPYTCCRLIHEAIEAALEARKICLSSGLSLKVDSIQKITVKTINEATYTHKCLALNAGALDKKYSLPFCVAAALICGDVNKEQFKNDLPELSQVLDLHKKIQATAEDDRIEKGYPETSRRSELTLYHATGQTISITKNLALGEPENPLSDDELIGKFTRWTRERLNPTQQEKIIDFCFGLDTVDQFDALG